MLRILPVLLCVAAHAQPVMYWHSGPVRPGETVVVTGGGWSATPTVELAPLPAGPDAPAPTAFKAVALLKGDDAGLHFVLPDGPPLQALRIDGTLVGTINRPEVWWVQDRDGEPLAPGRTLAGFGRGFGGELARRAGGGPRPTAGQGLAELVPAGGQARRLPCVVGDYAFELPLPGDLPPGEYRLRYSTGSGGALGWSEPADVTIGPAQVWPAQAFDVTAYGALGNGGNDDTPAFNAAIEAAAAAGGGIIDLPPGRYLLTQPIVLPPLVQLVGRDRPRVTLLWADTPEPFPAQIQGTHHFQVRNLTIHCSNHQHVIAGAVKPDEGWGDVVIENVVVRANPYRGHLQPEEVDERFRASLKLSTGGGDTVRVGGPNVRITGCDLYGGGRSLFLSGISNGVVRDNKLANGRWGWYSVSGADGIIMADNELRGGDLMSTGGGINCLYGYPRSQFVYYARNHLHDMHGWDREAMTSDAGGGAYYGPIASADGTTIRLPKPLDHERPTKWAQAALVILDGHGRGQYRNVVEATGVTVTIEQPFAIAPDATSLVSVTMLQRHYLFVDNRFEDAGIGIQFYGMAMEHLCDGNATVRSGGMHGLPLVYSNGVQPEFGMQFLNSVIEEGNSYRFGANNTSLSGPSRVAFQASREARLIGGVIRGCRLANDARIELRGGDGEVPRIEHVVIEGNHVANNDVGVFVDDGIRQVTVRNNTFEQVEREVRYLEDLRQEWAAARAAMMGPDGLLARWTFDQGLGDVTAHKLVASPAGDATVVDGRAGKGIRPGEHGWFQIGGPDTLEAAIFNLTDFTVSAWIKPDTIEGRYGIVVKRSANSSEPFGLSYRGDALCFEATDQAGKWSYNLTVGGQITAGEWQQLAVVVRSGQDVVLYRNGVEVGRKAVDQPVCSTDLPLRFGWDAWGGPQANSGQPAFFPGVIDDVAIWGQALDAAGVRAEYEARAAD